ncbi:MAG: TetR/AcrR family transcriptional regulator C-terminal domain-containing protein [Polyangia bacterium]
MALSRQEVLDGAMRVLDEVGLEALTMRRLAQSLRVQAGAIYWHFADKQDLIDAMSEAMMAKLLEPPPTGPWDEQLAELARRVTAALARHRDGARLATLALRPGPNGLAVSEAMLRIVRDAGFSKDVTLWATSVLGYYLLGYVTDVQALQAAKARGLEAVMRSIEKTIDRERYPLLHELSSPGIMQMMSSHAFETRFEFGLRVILDGLKATQKTTKTPTKSKRPRPRRRAQR